MTRDEWIAAFAREAGVDPPTSREIKQLLDIAAHAAHASERTAAPLACWIAGRAGSALPELLARAQSIEQPNSPGETRLSERSSPPRRRGRDSG